MKWVTTSGAYSIIPSGLGFEDGFHRLDEEGAHGQQGTQQQTEQE